MNSITRQIIAVRRNIGRVELSLDACLEQIARIDAEKARLQAAVDSQDFLKDQLKDQVTALEVEFEGDWEQLNKLLAELVEQADSA